MNRVLSNLFAYTVIFTSTVVLRLWIDMTYPCLKFNSIQSQRIRFVLDNTSRHIVLHDSDFSMWLVEEARNRTAKCATLWNMFCLQTPTGRGLSNCDLSQSNITQFDQDCGLELIRSLGSFPYVTSVQQNGSRLPEVPITYHPGKVYADRPDSVADRVNCEVKTHRREVLYRLLRHWILLAEEHNLVWWIGHGSLLGAVRDNDFIPYDRDLDIVVLDSAEPTVRQLAVTNGKLSLDKINLVVRTYNYCTHDHIPKLNCQGVPVRFQMDTCSFCTPLARLFLGYFNFLDIFMARIELHRDANGNPIQLGVVDEGSDDDFGTKLSSTVGDVFPLSTCEFMGLNVPCPRNAHVILTHLYGESYKRPNKVCNVESGTWTHV